MSRARNSRAQLAVAAGGRRRRLVGLGCLQKEGVFRCSLVSRRRWYWGLLAEETCLAFALYSQGGCGNRLAQLLHG
jgi:hypothetical protein